MLEIKEVSRLVGCLSRDAQLCVRIQMICFTQVAFGEFDLWCFWNPPNRDRQTLRPFEPGPDGLSRWGRTELMASLIQLKRASSRDNLIEEERGNLDRFPKDLTLYHQPGSWSCCRNREIVLSAETKRTARLGRLYKQSKKWRHK